MKINKFLLLTATAATACGTAAQAQFVFQPVELHGAGASLVQNIIRQSGDCYGAKSNLGFGVSSPSTAPSSVTISDFDFNPPPADTLANRFNCAQGANDTGDLLTRTVQPDVKIRYLSTGSGQGRVSFLNNRVSSTIDFSNDFDGGDYDSADGYQFGSSESPLSATEINTYNTALINPFGRYAAADTAKNLFGPAIQIPVVVAVVGLSYDPVYAKQTQGGTVVEYKFTVVGARTDGSGGLKLTRAQYCGILNGTITNWNQLPATVVKKDPNDAATFNVPIRLAGRSETSGTSTLFTRAMAAQCTGLSVNTGVGGTAPLTPIDNKFLENDELPYNGSVLIASTAYSAGSNNTKNAISGAFFNKATDVLSGTEVPGLFTVANGNDGVAELTALHPNPNVLVEGDRTLNGRIAYLSPEQFLPSVLFTNTNPYMLHSASLQQNGTGSVFVTPNAKGGTAAFGTIKPPQSKGAAGAYTTDSTQVGYYGDRANPADWVPAGLNIAAPVKGYPITGTGNLLLYTCYATPARRIGMTGYLAHALGKVTKDSLNQAMPALLEADPVNGVFAKNGLAPMPAAWRTAIAETFLKKSVQVGIVGNPATQLGLRNLWIQDKIPTTPTGVGSVTAGNPTCDVEPGA